MRYTTLGDSGLRVSEVCLGTMTFGTDWGFGADEATCRRQFELFAGAGGTFVDTANRYTNGTAETMVGEFVRADRERFVVATKYSLTTGGHPNSGGNSRRSLHTALEASLRRLQMDYVDLLWLHAWDYVTPAEEVMRALDDVVRSGKVLYVGISDTPAWIVARMQTLAQLRGWTPLVGLQVQYSLASREPEAELIPMAHALGLGVTAWAPLGGGLLSGKYARPAAGDEQRRLGKDVDPAQLRVAQEVSAVADELGVPAVQVALAWLRAKDGVIPIVGARTVEQLEGSLGYLEIEVPQGCIRRLDEVSAVRKGFPHEFLTDNDWTGSWDLQLPAGRRFVGR
ncbi:MAG: aldo/keto reductase [Actinomycetota bacterium]|nr:aldo/keto reductase [Actinomycetota bacterium]